MKRSEFGEIVRLAKNLIKEEKNWGEYEVVMSRSSKKATWARVKMVRLSHKGQLSRWSAWAHIVINSSYSSLYILRFSISKNPPSLKGSAQWSLMMPGSTSGAIKLFYRTDQAWAIISSSRS